MYRAKRTDRDDGIDRPATNADGAPNRTAGCLAAAPSSDCDELHQIRADLYYVASDLRSLARQATADQAAEILALSDLIASVAAKWR